MTKYIDRAKTLKEICEQCGGDCDEFDLCDDCLTIYGMPTINIVHCEECKYYEANRCWRRLVDCNPTPDWFCADGIRKESDTDG